MKHTKLIAWILAAVLCSGTILAGCGKSEETEEAETAEGTVVMEEERQEIGDPTASLEILLTNEMGSVITELSLKSPSEAEYPDSMMTADQEIEDGETVTFFYEPVTEADFQSAGEEAENPDDDSEEDSVTESTYSLQVTMENGDVYEFSDFDVEDMEEVTLYLEDGVAYIEYMSISQNVLINTKEREQEIKADKEAAQVVIDMIAAIGTVTAENAKEHRDEIEAAREAYDALTDEQKAYVTNLDLLEDMEHTLNAMNTGKTQKATKGGSKKPVYEGEGAYIEGYDLGIVGYSKDDPEVTRMVRNWTDIEAEYDYPGAVDEFWEGYNDGYAEYEKDRENDTAIANAEALGIELGQAGYLFEDALAEAKNRLGITTDSDYYYDFLGGYDYGYSLYEGQLAQEEQEPEEEESEQDEDLPEGEPVYY